MLLRRVEIVLFAEELAALLLVLLSYLFVLLK